MKSTQIPVDVILRHLADLLIERPAESFSHLGKHLARAIDPRIVAEDWWNAEFAHAIPLLARLDGKPAAPSHLPVEIAVARRLADVALSLLVTQDDGDRAASTCLLDAAQRIAGVTPAPANCYAEAMGLQDANTAWREWALKFSETKSDSSIYLSDAALREAVEAYFGAHKVKADLYLTQLEGTRKTIAGLWDEHGNLKAQYDTRMAESINTCNELRATIAALRAEIDAWNMAGTMVDSMREQRAGQQDATIVSLRKQLEASTTAAAERKEAYEHLQTDLATLRTSLRDAEHQTACMVNEANLIAAFYAGWKDEAAAPAGTSLSSAVIASIRVLVISRNEAQSQVAELRTEMRAADALYNERGAELARWKAIAAECTARLQGACEAANLGVVWTGTFGSPVGPVAEVTPTPRAFKVGDRVRYARRDEKQQGHDVPALGFAGLITRMDDDSFPARVDDGLTYWYFAPESLDLITPAP